MNLLNDWITSQCTQDNSETWTEFNLWKYFEMSETLSTMRRCILVCADAKTKAKERNKKWRESHKNGNGTEFMNAQRALVMISLIAEDHRSTVWRWEEPMVFLEVSLLSISSFRKILIKVPLAVRDSSLVFRFTPSTSLSRGMLCHNDFSHFFFFWFYGQINQKRRSDKLLF